MSSTTAPAAYAPAAAMGPARPRPDLHDGHQQPPIRQDRVHQAAWHRPLGLPCRHPGHIHHPGRLADLLQPVPGLADRAVRPEAAHQLRVCAHRIKLGSGRTGGVAGNALPDLRRAGGARHRHRLCRRGRPDGPLVPEPPRLRRRCRRCRLWHGRHRHQRQHHRWPRCAGLPGDLGALRPYSRHGRRARRPRAQVSARLRRQPGTGRRSRPNRAA